LKEEGASEAEIQEEVSIILVQLGYVKQMQRKNEQALELYNSVLKNK
jgi:signal recognition particle subunit SRP72